MELKVSNIEQKYRKDKKRGKPEEKITVLGLSILDCTDKTNFTQYNEQEDYSTSTGNFLTNRSYFFMRHVVCI